jgi:hypothetical protein
MCVCNVLNFYLIISINLHFYLTIYNCSWTCYCFENVRHQMEEVDIEEGRVAVMAAHSVRCGKGDLY